MNNGVDASDQSAAVGEGLSRDYALIEKPGLWHAISAKFCEVEVDVARGGWLRSGIDVIVPPEKTMTVAFARTAWEPHAACRGRQSTFFFPPARESTPQRQIREAAAKQICSQCPVQPQCLDYALRLQEPFGIWGGLNEAERRDVPETARRSPTVGFCCS